jgi:hypothetical protein
LFSIFADIPPFKLFFFLILSKDVVRVATGMI